MFSKKQIEDLDAKMLKEHVRSRKNYGGGGNLYYVSQDHCIYEANRIFGFDGWSRETIKLANLGQRDYQKGANDMYEVGYMAHVRVTVFNTLENGTPGVIIREGTGFGNGSGSNPVAIHELAVKEAESDAMKRALMTFGNQFGLALYDKEQPNVVANRASAGEARKEGLYEDMVEDLRQQTTPDQHDEWWVRNKGNRAKLPKGWVENLREEFKSCKQSAQALEAAKAQLDQGTFPRPGGS